MASRTTIQLKKSANTSAVPSNLEIGELAINYADGKLYYKNVNNQIVEFAPQTTSNYFGTVDANGTLVIADTTNDILSLAEGTNIKVTGDAINDKITLDLKDLINVENMVANSMIVRNANLTIGRGDSTVGSGVRLDVAGKVNASGFLVNGVPLTGGGGGGGSSVTVDSSAPGSPSNGDLWYNTNIGKLLLYYNDGDSSQWVEVTSNYITSNTPTPSAGSLAWKSASIEYPETYNKIPLFFTANAITVQQIVPAVIGSGIILPSVTFSVRYGTDPNDTGTEVKVNGINITSSNNGAVFTTFDNASIPANNYIWAYLSHATTTTDWLNLTIGF